MSLLSMAVDYHPRPRVFLGSSKTRIVTCSMYYPWLGDPRHSRNSTSKQRCQVCPSLLTYLCPIALSLCDSHYDTTAQQRNSNNDNHHNNPSRFFLLEARHHSLSPIEHATRATDGSNLLSSSHVLTDSGLSMRCCPDHPTPLLHTTALHGRVTSLFSLHPSKHSDPFALQLCHPAIIRSTVDRITKGER